MPSQISDQELSETAIRYGIWRERHGKPLITELRDYQGWAVGKESVVLEITQLNLPAREQKRVVREWCQAFAGAWELKQVSFHSRVTQEIFDAVCSVPNLEALWVKWSGIVHLDSLAAAKQLRHLYLGSSSKVESIEVLSEMRSLVTLGVQQFNRIDDFSPLETLQHLKGLGVDGSMWTQQRLRNLKPFGKLVNLRYLTLTSTQAADKSFDPLLNLRELVRFDCSWKYPEAEFAKLKQLPNLRYGNVETSWNEIRAKLPKRHD